MRKLNGLWIGKTGDANCWYHIYPFAKACQTDKLYIVRYKKAFKEIPNSCYYLYKCKGNHFDYLRYFIKGFHVLMRNRIDYIVTFNPAQWGLISWLLAKLFRKKVIVGFIGDDFNKHLKRIFYISSHSDIITVTGSNMKTVLEKKGIESDRIMLYPHCVDDSWFKPTEPAQKIYDIIVVGQLIKRKRIQDLILALTILKNHGINLKLCILGSGPEKEYLIKVAKEKNVYNQIYFKGYQKDVKYYLDRSRIYVQASKSEGFSISLVEAIARGLVPIITMAGSEADHIKEGFNGYFYPVADTEELANKLKEAINTKNYNKIQNNILKYRYTFSITRAIETSESILRKVADDKI